MYCILLHKFTTQIIMEINKRRDKWIMENTEMGEKRASEADAIKDDGNNKLQVLEHQLAQAKQEVND